MRERLLQFCQLCCWPVDLDTDELRHCQCRREHRADVLQMLEQCVRVDVAFTTKDFVAIDGELVKEVPRFVARFADEFRQNRLQ